MADNNLVTVEALSTVTHGAEGQPTKTYEAGDTFQVTAREAQQLAAVNVVKLDESGRDAVGRLNEQDAANESPVGPTTLPADNTVSTAGLKAVTSQPIEPQPTTPEEFQQPKLTVADTTQQDQPTQEQIDAALAAAEASSTQRSSEQNG